MVHYPRQEADLLAEPTLDEVLAEPIVALIMKRDGVVSGDMRDVLERIRRSYEATLLNA